MIELKLKTLFDLRAAKDKVEAQAKSIEEEIEKLEEEIVDEFESRQIKSMKIDGMANFVMAVSSYPKVNDPALMRQWLDEQGISWETVSAFNAKKFQGFYKELLDAGKPLPPGTENFVKSKIKVCKV